MPALSPATRRALAAAGVDGLYGDPVGGLPVVPVPAGPLRALLAAAHRRVHGRLAAVVDGTDLFVDGVALSAGGGRADLAAALGRCGAGDDRSGDRGRGDDRTGSAGGQLDRPDVDAGGARAERRIAADPVTVAAVAAARAPVVLAGPGVVTDGAVPGLHALATAGSLGVLNTWGAKGVFDWRSPHHLATAGLQQRDFELGGLADADLIVATGVDEAEAPSPLWRLAPVVVVAPGALDATAEVLDRPKATPAMPPLRTALAAVTQAGWAAAGAPLAPTQATRGYATVLGRAGGLVAADAGWAGYWVARTFATTQLGGAVVPATRCAGFAAACALVARLRQPLRPVVAAVDAVGSTGTVDATTCAVLDLALELGIGIAVEVWCADGDELDAAAHARRLESIAVTDRPTTVMLATEPTLRERMVDVAGPVIAWGGL